jgi:hypothetical protein
MIDILEPRNISTSVREDPLWRSIPRLRDEEAVITEPDHLVANAG